MAHGKSRLVGLVADDGRRYVAREEKGPEQRYGKRFVISFVDDWAEAAACLSGTEFRVLGRLPKHLSYKDFRPLPREMLAAELNVSGAAVSTALVRLCKAGYIERKGKGPVTQWRLSIDLGWQGSAPVYHKAKRARAEQAKPRLKVITGKPAA